MFVTYCVCTQASMKVRYLAFTSDVGEAVRPVVPAWFLPPPSSLPLPLPLARHPRARTRTHAHTHTFQEYVGAVVGMSQEAEASKTRRERSGEEGGESLGFQGLGFPPRLPF